VSASAPNFPPQPRSIDATGLTLAAIANLALKTLYVHGSVLGHEIAEILKLPYVTIVDDVLEQLRHERLIEVKGSTSVGKAAYRYAMLQKGQARARELMHRNQYVGPAPVPLAAYVERVRAQSLTGQTIPDDTLRRALASLVLSDAVINQLGPAINSGKAMFIFGNVGNGKTTIAEAIGAILPGAIWIPHAIDVDGQIIRLYDPGHHRAVEEKATPEIRSGALRYLPSKGELYDQRWVLIHRPLIEVGGELTLKNLSPVFDPVTKFFEAPYQLKANGGVFLVDDLGRQRIRPHTLLNRWIVPLEKRIDHLPLVGGQTVNVPFDVLVIFATNLKPEDLVDEAYLRRIRYKINVPDPTWDEYREIFKREAAKRNIPYAEEGLRHLIAEYYNKRGQPARGCHPRDLLEGLALLARFRGVAPRMTKEMIDLACLPYFLKMQDAEESSR
jgi:predicted ATPase with chaperone activity